MKSNRMVETLDALRFRVTAPELGLPESIGGAVITALNEEAVAAAALANKGGINIIVTYEAFGAKMHDAVRQEITFANQRKQSGRALGWLSVPVVLTLAYLGECEERELAPGPHYD
jgi:phosphoketolase